MLITCPKCSAQYQIPEGVRIPNGKKMKCSNCQHVFVLPEESVIDDSEEMLEKEPQQVDIDPVVDEVTSEPVFAEDDVFMAEEVPQPFKPVEPVATQEKKGVGILWALLSLVAFVVLIGAGILYRDMFFKENTSVKQMQVKPEMEIVMPSPELKQAEYKRHQVDKYVEESPQFVALPQIQSVRFEKRQDIDLEIRIEGVLNNTTDQEMVLPEKVRAFAYDTQGNVLFEKEIYLTDKVLPAGKTLAFFGTYQPAPEGVQWIDVTF